MIENVSVLITAYEESRKPDKLERAMTSTLHGPVNEIIIVDDASSDSHRTEIRVEAWKDACDKVAKGELAVKFYRNEKNLGVFGNKLAAIRSATGDWCQSIDSDNCFSASYWLVLEQLECSPRRMISPSFAMPHFDYRAMAGKTLKLPTLAEFAAWKTFGCLVNTGNQFFNRAEMLRVTHDRSCLNNQLLQPDYFGVGKALAEVKWRKVYDSADSFYFNKLWLEAGNEIYVAPDLHYHHEVHEGSSWKAAPAEKEVLPAIYYAELADVAAGRSRSYRFRRTVSHGGRRCAELAYNSKRILVDYGTLTIWPG